MGTLAFILLIMGIVLPFIGVGFILFGAILLDIDDCAKIGCYLCLAAIICFIGSVIVDNVDLSKKVASNETEIAKEKIVTVVKTKKEPIIDTTIVIKNGAADTTFTYKFRK